MTLSRTLRIGPFLGSAFGLILTAPLARSAENEAAREAIPGPPAHLIATVKNPRRTPIVEAVERARAAVVNIHSERLTRNPGSDEVFSGTATHNRINGMGTGVIVDPRGYIVTNQHVVEDVSVIRVRLSDGTSLNAKVLAREQEADLALLKVDAPRPLPTIPLGTATDLMVGETVIAMGNAYGYENSVTVGVVSAIKRDVSLNKEISYKALIQTDASINPGNSGGPLLNINGDLVGVNVAIRAGAQGIGFAIPVDTMLRVVADMLSIRRRAGLWHGVVYRDQLSPPPVSTDGVPGSGLNRSVVIERLETGGPGDKAGLQKGDLLVQVAGERVASGLDVERLFLDRGVGEAIPVLVKRKAGDVRLEIVLQPLDRTNSASPELIARKLGLRLTPAGGESVSRSNQHLRGGLTVQEVLPESAAAKAGIAKGDVLIGLHQWETISLDNVAYVLNHAELATFMPLRFYIVRGGAVHSGWLQQLP